MAQLLDITLSVPEISGEHCVKTINQALGELPGVESVNTDIPTKTVRLRYDSEEVTMAKITSVLDDVGYAVAS